VSAAAQWAHLGHARVAEVGGYTIVARQDEVGWSRVTVLGRGGEVWHGRTTQVNWWLAAAQRPEWLAEMQQAERDALDERDRLRRAEAERDAARRDMRRSESAARETWAREAVESLRGWGHDAAADLLAEAEGIEADDDADDGSCSACHGSGGGDYPMACGYCSGRGYARLPRYREEPGW